jgi:hypothetical protein
MIAPVPVNQGETRMEHNVYAAPQSVVDDSAMSRSLAFYVVSPGKYWTLMLVCGVFYTLPWFYLQLRARDPQASGIGRVLKTCFMIFFIYGLFSNIADAAERKTKGFGFQPALWTAVFVAVTICSLGLQYFARGATWAVFVSLALIPVGYFPGFKAQVCANFAAGDPGGSGNSQLTAVNWVFIVLGAMYWMVTLLSLLAIIAQAAS